jgi:hypothetical protein
MGEESPKITCPWYMEDYNSPKPIQQNERELQP